MKKIGFIGIGLMGLPMAKNILKSGYKLTAFNRSPNKADLLKEFGAEIAKSLGELVNNSDVIITMLTDDKAVDEVMNNQNFVENLKSEKILIDMSSVKPITAKKHANSLKLKDINYLDAEKIGKMTIENFEKKEFDVCTIFYNKFKNVITQIPQEQQIIPLKTSEAEENSSEDNYEFEPDEDEILSNLLPKNISTQIFKAMLENSASEQGSRMSAMDNATRNAGEMVDKLTIEYNRSRQAAITKELIEIISGAESL